MTLLDLIGHVGYIYIVVGMVLLAHSKPLGWVCRFIGELLWIFVGCMLGMSSIWFWGIVFCCIDLYGVYKWHGK